MELTLRLALFFGSHNPDFYSTAIKPSAPLDSYWGSFDRYI